MVGKISQPPCNKLFKTSENHRITALGDKFASLRKEAAIHFVALDDNDSDSSGQRVYRITPVGNVRDPDKSLEGFDNELGWTLTKPKDNDYNGILLSSEKPTIECVADKFKDCDFVIDDFELGSPHAWRRMF